MTIGTLPGAATATRRPTMFARVAALLAVLAIASLGTPPLTAAAAPSPGPGQCVYMTGS